jgi:hypothetical protein
MVAEQARRHLTQYRGGPFDWLVTPFDALPRVFWTRGQHLGETFVCADGGRTVQCKHYGLIYQHEFVRDHDGRVMFDAEHVAACRSRLAHKMSKLMAAADSGDRVLFIRAFSSTGTSADRFNDGVFQSEDIHDLVRAIEIAAPNCDFDVLFVHSGDRVSEKLDLSGPLPERVMVRDIPHPDGMHWSGNDQDWRTLFRDFGLSLKATAQAA